MLPLCAQQEEVPAIAIVPQDGFNMKLDELLNAHYVISTIDPPIHNWFAGTFTNLPVKEPVTIGLSLKELPDQPTLVDLKKWIGLQPLFTYADPTRYETYEWFVKNAQGQWVSNDPLKRGETRFAGTGKLPEQPAIPNDIAEQFLSIDGNYWQPWRDIADTEINTQVNIFRIKQKFDYSSASVAMHYPFTYTYQQLIVGKLKNAQLARIMHVERKSPTPRHFLVG